MQHYFKDHQNNSFMISKTQTVLHQDFFVLMNPPPAHSHWVDIVVFLQHTVFQWNSNNDSYCFKGMFRIDDQFVWLEEGLIFHQMTPADYSVAYIVILIFVLGPCQPLRFFLWFHHKGFLIVSLIMLIFPPILWFMAKYLPDILSVSPSSVLISCLYVTQCCLVAS